MSNFDGLKKTHTANVPTDSNIIGESETKEFDLNIEKILENWERK